MTDAKDCTLHRWHGRAQSIGKSFAIAAEHADRMPIYGFTYTRSAARLFRIADDGTARYGDGRPVDFTEAFEARVFCAAWEMRWLRDGLEARVAMLTDNETLAAGFAASPKDRFFMADGRLEPIEGFCLPNRYLLWGELDDDQSRVAKGWTRLSSYRIGTLDVPFDDLRGERGIALTATEYFHHPKGMDGNCVFAGERLTGFAPANRPRAKEKTDDQA
jgi:CRISPR-associated protein (TIGR03984 family)